MHRFRSFASGSTPAAARLLFFLVLWTGCAWAVTSSGLQRGSVAYPLVPQWSTFGPQSKPALWQLPEGPVDKVLVIFTPKGSHPSSFWDNSPGCRFCEGMPERRNIVEDAISRNYAVFVPDSVVPEWGSWPEDNPDVVSVETTITEWKKQEGLHNVPTMAIGISCGGWILSTLALRAGFFDAICLMISAGLKEAIEASTSQYPPTIFVHMPLDSRIAPRVPRSRNILDSRGVLTAEEKWYSHPLTPDWFSNSIVGVDVTLSTAIFNSVKSEGWVDEVNFLTSNAYKTTWPNEARRWGILPNDNSRYMLEDAIEEELDVAYAYHVSISRKDEAIFSFFDGACNSLESPVSPSLSVY